LGYIFNKSEVQTNIIKNILVKEGGERMKNWVLNYFWDGEEDFKEYWKYMFKELKQTFKMK